MKSPEQTEGEENEAQRGKRQHKVTAEMALTEHQNKTD